MPPETDIDWVRAYNDLRWLLALQRAVATLGLSASLAALLTELYDPQSDREHQQRHG